MQTLRPQMFQSMRACGLIYHRALNHARFGRASAGDLWSSPRSNIALSLDRYRREKTPSLVRDKTGALTQNQRRYVSVRAGLGQGSAGRCGGRLYWSKYRGLSWPSPTRVGYTITAPSRAPGFSAALEAGVVNGVAIIHTLSGDMLSGGRRCRRRTPGRLIPGV